MKSIFIFIFVCIMAICVYGAANYLAKLAAGAEYSEER